MNTFFGMGISKGDLMRLILLTVSFLLIFAGTSNAQKNKDTQLALNQAITFNKSYGTSADFDFITLYGMKVFQITGENKALLKKNGAIYSYTGSTAGWVDDVLIDEARFVKVSGRETYSTAIGGTNTVITLRDWTDEEKTEYRDKLVKKLESAKTQYKSVFDIRESVDIKLINRITVDRKADLIGVLNSKHLIFESEKAVTCVGVESLHAKTLLGIGHRLESLTAINSETETTAEDCMPTPKLGPQKFIGGGNNRIVISYLEKPKMKRGKKSNPKEDKSRNSKGSSK